MKLLDFLKSSGANEEALAAAIGCSVGAVRKWAYGERIPRREQMLRITEATAGAVTANDFHHAPAPPSRLPKTRGSNMAVSA